mgnify:CR=1 FL=1
MQTQKPDETDAFVPAGLAPVGDIVATDALSGRDGSNRSRAGNRQLDADTDHDRLTDGEELDTDGTDPLVADTDGTQILSVRDPILAPNTDPNFRGFDLDYPDVDRAKEFLDELKDFEKDGKMPQFMIMRLGNDHTSGTSAGKIAPLSAAADNDLAVGMIIEGLSKSKFWGETAVFIVEDDAQNGPDHVDSHRSPAYVDRKSTRLNSSH